jgi:hypothetical protein
VGRDRELLRPAAPARAPAGQRPPAAAQRFAIDFNRLDPQNRLVVGDPGLSPSYPTYGQPVLAVADATVVDVVDRFSDQIPNAPTAVGLAEASGNR